MRTSRPFSILVLFNKFQAVNPGCLSSQPHTFSAQLLFDETYVQPDISAIMNWPVVAFSVFYSTVLMHSLVFLQLRPALTKHWACSTPPF